MKEFDVRVVVPYYCKVAQLKESKYPTGEQIAATHIFGAQQLAVLCWAEAEKEFDIQKVIVMLAFHANNDICDHMSCFVEEFYANRTIEAKLAHMFLDVEALIQKMGMTCYLDQVKLIKSKHYVVGNEAKITDEEYDELCSELTQWRNFTNFKDVSEKLHSFCVLNSPLIAFGTDTWNRILARYCILSELKDKVRMGPIYWNVKTSHYEVVSEHAFGTQSLAWLMNIWERRMNLDIYRIVLMLAIHETEESIMPDFTPYDPVSASRMLEMGTKAVKVIFGGLKKYEYINSLLDEFNARKTPEGMFAHRCDKLEFIFRMKMYCDLKLCTIEEGQSILLNAPDIQENIAKGAKTVADLIIIHEMPKFVGTNFEHVVNYLTIYDTCR